METKDYITNYYERYDENGRLISKHGMLNQEYASKLLNLKGVTVTKAASFESEIRSGLSTISAIVITKAASLRE